MFASRPRLLVLLASSALVTTALAGYAAGSMTTFDAIVDEAATPPPDQVVHCAIREVPHLVVEDLVVGTGASPRVGDKIVVAYTGWLLVDGVRGRQIDATDEAVGLFSAPIGKGYLIRGWEEGVLSMRVGGKRRLVIPPDLAYGEHGAGARIPPSSTLEFVIELRAVE